MKEKVKPRIVIDDRIRHGKPIITGTRITVDGTIEFSSDISRNLFPNFKIV